MSSESVIEAIFLSILSMVYGYHNSYEIAATYNAAACVCWIVGCGAKQKG